MVFESLRKSFRNTFSQKSKHQKGTFSVDGKKLLACKIALLDGTDVSINLQKNALGKDLVKRVLLHLDLVERDYFGLQFMDTKQVPHWLDPMKKVKKQVQIGPPFTFHFRVKFYAMEPHKLQEELTRYHFFLQLKQDIRQGKLRPTLKQAIDLGAFAVQSEVGDFDNTIHIGNYISEFRLYPEQNEELERSVEKKHRLLAGMNPAECETNYLAIARNLEYYGMDKHAVMGEDGKEYTVGLTPHGIIIMKGDQKLGFHVWKNITNITFKQARFVMCARTNEAETEEYRYLLTTPRASKHLWKCSIEYHTFFRLTQTTEAPENKQSLLHFGSRFRYSGRTLHQATKDDNVNARKSMLFKRTRSERFAQRSTIGYIRVGSIVWARAVNGDYYRGTVTVLSDKIHVKFENGDTISHERADDNALVFDMDPNANEIKIGTRVIAHWSGLSAFLLGTVTKIEGNKYHVLYDDGDRGTNRLEQIRILKPPLFFGPGSGRSKIQKKYSMKTTALIGSNSNAGDSNKMPVSADISQPRHPKRNASEREVSTFQPDGPIKQSSSLRSNQQVGRKAPSPHPSTQSLPNQQDASLKANHQPQKRNPSPMPSTHSLTSSQEVLQKGNNQQLGVEVSRTQSADSRDHSKNNFKQNGQPRSQTLDPVQRTRIPNKQTPPLNTQLKHDPKTGNNYQITDL